MVRKAKLVSKIRVQKLKHLLASSDEGTDSTLKDIFMQLYILFYMDNVCIPTEFPGLQAEKKKILILEVHFQAFLA